jgi:hypothetical protein
MPIIKRYGRKYPHCSRARQGLKRGCIASARRYDAEVGFVNLTLGPSGILSCTRIASVSSHFVGSGKQCRHRDMQLSGRNMTAMMVSP